MKQIVITSLLLVLTVNNTQAQFRRMKERMEREKTRREQKGPPSALQIIGVSAIPVGGIVLLSGFADYVWTGGQDDLGPVLIGAGGCLIAAGIILLVVNHNHKHNHPYRLSAVTPGRNELGIAYNFR